MAGYLAFGEWQAADDEMSQQGEAQGPHLLARVRRCPWHCAWEDEGLMAYGGLYCLDIDEALVRGFNPELRLDVRSTLTGGDEACEFVFHDVDWEPAKGGRVVMPWEYHLGHLFQAVSEVFVEKMGEEGRAAADEALAEFARRYGQEASEAVAAYRDTDFDRLPEPVGGPLAGSDEP
jgi:hypothetical protein